MSINYLVIPSCRNRTWKPPELKLVAATEAVKKPWFF